MGSFKLPEITNEPVFSYAPGTEDRKRLEEALDELKKNKIDVPMIIGGKEVRTGDPIKITAPHDHSLEIGQYYKGGPKEINDAIAAAAEAKKEWEQMPWADRASIFLKAADLLTGPYRYLFNAAAMLGHSKNAFQSEIDAVCEFADFLRFGVAYADEVYRIQPGSAKGIWDRLEFRALEGFVFAVTPFNFISIAGNLPSAPAMMGNVSLWKPASSVTYTAHFIMKIFKEAGLPDGVINMVTARGADVGEHVLKHKDLAGIHFTGSTATFQTMWRTIGENIANYRSYPRIVGETGGKDFIVVHNSADLKAVNANIVRGAFEYQGQKCSAVSRVYIPKSLWPQLKEMLLDTVKSLKMGTPDDFGNFVNAVIDRAAFESITEYIDYAKDSDEHEIIAGGNYDDSKGFFIEPTVVVSSNPHSKLMEEEIFGPVVTLYVYDDNDYLETLKTCDETSPYALTGAIFARERKAIMQADSILRHAAGNFYINDKPTGAVVGQQPFGGARASGTNDKAGSVLNMVRWVSARNIKENFLTPRDYRYPFMGEESIWESLLSNLK